MKSKFATTLVATAIALGSVSSFAFVSGAQPGAAQDRAPAAIAVNPQGPVLASQPTFQSEQSRAQVRSETAQGHTPLAAVAMNPQGPSVVSQPVFESNRSRRQVRLETAQSHPTLSAIATNPQGDSVVVSGAGVRDDRS